MTGARTKSLVGAFVGLFLCLTSATSCADDWDLFAGRWKSESLMRLRAEAREVFDGTIWVFEKEKMTAFKDGKEYVSFRMKLNENTQPKQYDLEYLGDDPFLKELYGRKVCGIYEFYGDTLRRCYSLQDRPRPEKFDGTGDAFLQVFKRVPKDAK